MTHLGHPSTRKLVSSMVFTVVTFFYLGIMFVIAAVMEFCMLRLDRFRRTQQAEFPALCGLVNTVFGILHLNDIFALDEFYDEHEEEYAEPAPAAPKLTVIEGKANRRSTTYHRAA